MDDAQPALGAQDRGDAGLDATVNPNAIAWRLRSAMMAGMLLRAGLMIAAALAALPAQAEAPGRVPEAAERLLAQDPRAAVALVTPLVADCRRASHGAACVPLMMLRAKALAQTDMMAGADAFEAVLALSDRESGPASSASEDALMGLAILLPQVARYARAREVYERLLPIAEARFSRSHTGVLFLTGVYAQVLVALDRKRALAAYDDLIPRIRAAGSAQLLVTNLLGRAILFDGEPERAAELKRDILREAAIEQVEPELRIRVLASLAASLVADKDVEGALVEAGRAVQLAGTSPPLQTAAAPASAIIARYAGTGPPRQDPAARCSADHARLGIDAPQTALSCIVAAGGMVADWRRYREGKQLIERFYPRVSASLNGEILHGVAALIYASYLQQERQIDRANAFYAQGFGVLDKTRMTELSELDLYTMLYSRNLLDAGQPASARRLSVAAAMRILERSRKSAASDAGARKMLNDFSPLFRTTVAANWQLSASRR